ncbi:MAG TPA: hypothetical protein VK760_14370 [Candidatus Acidoferrales bacterium]|nr:hypothetical protein [Candidatus Acidoferrales bacterium]
MAGFIAGCAGNGTTSSGIVPTAQTPQQQHVAAAPASASSASSHASSRLDQCVWWSCWLPRLVAPLQYDGTNFSVVSLRNCNFFDLLDAKPYRATASGPVAVNGNINLTPPCSSSGPKVVRKGDGWGWPQPTPPPRSLYIIGIQISGFSCFGVKHDGRRAHTSVRQPHDNDDWPVGIVAGPVSENGAWSFPAFNPGFNLKAKSEYVFFVVDMPTVPGTAPAPTPTPVATPAPNGVFNLVAPVNYSGGTFSIPSGTTCGSVGLGSASSFVASASGAFVSPSAVITLPNTCAPATGLVYLIAVEQPAGGSGSSANGWIVAGADSASDSPWLLDVVTPGLVMKQGTSYAFYVGQLAGK